MVYDDDHGKLTRKDNLIKTQLASTSTSDTELSNTNLNENKNEGGAIFGRSSLPMKSLKALKSAYSQEYNNHNNNNKKKKINVTPRRSRSPQRKNHRWRKSRTRQSRQLRTISTSRNLNTNKYLYNEELKSGRLQRAQESRGQFERIKKRKLVYIEDSPNYCWGYEPEGNLKTILVYNIGYMKCFSYL